MARVSAACPLHERKRALVAGLQGVLRTRETIERFKRVPTQPGTTSPLLIYFGTILTKSSLNADESVELGRLVMSQNKKPLLDNWWKVGGGREGVWLAGGRVDGRDVGAGKRLQGHA